MGQYEAAKVICDSIKTAEIVFRDADGKEIFTYYFGIVHPGDTITYKVPVPDDIKITLT